MSRGKYTAVNISRELDVPYMAVMELRNKLKITKMTEDSYKYLKNTAEYIRDRHGYLSLSTINRYLLCKYNLNWEDKKDAI